MALALARLPSSVRTASTDDSPISNFVGLAKGFECEVANHISELAVAALSSNTKTTVEISPALVASFQGITNSAASTEASVAQMMPDFFETVMKMRYHTAVLKIRETTTGGAVRQNQCKRQDDYPAIIVAIQAQKTVLNMIPLALLNVFFKQIKLRTHCDKVLLESGDEFVSLTIIKLSGDELQQLKKVFRWSTVTPLSVDKMINEFNELYPPAANRASTDD